MDECVSIYAKLYRRFLGERVCENRLDRERGERKVRKEKMTKTTVTMANLTPDDRVVKRRTRTYRRFL